MTSLAVPDGGSIRRVQHVGQLERWPRAGGPMAWFARLFSARREQREGRASMRTFSVAGLLEGLGDRTRRGGTVAA